MNIEYWALIILNHYSPTTIATWAKARNQPDFHNPSLKAGVKSGTQVLGALAPERLAATDAAATTATDSGVIDIVCFHGFTFYG